LTKENVKGHCPGVVSIVGMSLRLVSYDHGRLARDETPRSLWENFIVYIYILFFIIFFLREAHILLKSKGWYKEV
jgi:uncharacterized membrane protein YobD (UPF0266 family)